MSAVLGRTYEGQNCSAARALEVVGERWTLLILRDILFRGMVRFSEIQRSLNVATNILSARLDTLVDNGVLDRRFDSGNAGVTYQPTEKGLDFKPSIIALTAWGDRWAAPDGPPVRFHHDGCGGVLKLSLTCSACGEHARSGDAVAVSKKRR